MTTDKLAEVINDLRTVDGYGEEELRAMYRMFNEGLLIVMKAIVDLDQ